ncbi:glycosyltransferase family 39 protein [Umbelopsis sp. AD052]|nr:glycosyltransferase family 39 protein [Umbelopsis sp. AD052]
MSKVQDRYQIHKSEKSSMRSGIKLSKKDIGMVLAVLTFGCYVRLWNLSWPSSVVFEEASVGKFYSDYLTQTFSLDINPPVGKLLLVLGTLSSGFDGQFDFTNLGRSYASSDVPYVRLRMICATMGALAIPTAYLTLRLAGYTRAASITAALMICYENSNIAISRFINLDSMLLCFTAITTMSWMRFEKLHNSPFTAQWWLNLIMTGLGLGLIISTKWAGIFTVGFIGLRALSQIWMLIGNRQTSIISIAKHAFCRSLCLLLFPSVIYLSIFYVHVSLMTNTGTHARTLMSRPFQHNLVGSEFNGTYSLVANNTLVRLRHQATNGGFLHSHKHPYPAGSKQQQVTVYSNGDDNNLWYISKKMHQSSHTTLILPGDIVRFRHLSTGTWLHSHDLRAPLSNGDHYNEASAYGAEDDWFNDWKVEVVDYEKSDPSSKTTLKALRTKIRLVHVGTQCSLMSKDMRLPNWGFGQQEVTCVKGKSKNTVWYIENSWPNLDTQEGNEIINYLPMSMSEKVRDVLVAMWSLYENLKDSHSYLSTPSSWIMSSRGIPLYQTDDIQFHAIGNPAVFYSTALALVTIASGYVLRLLFEKRKIQPSLEALPAHVDQTIGFFFYGWACHFLPYILVGKQLSLSSYMIALYFGVLLATSLLEAGVFPLNLRKRVLVVILVNALVYHSYRTFTPITYGTSWTNESCEASKWQKTWNYDCSM